jgi:hypothetical protein
MCNINVKMARKLKAYRLNNRRKSAKENESVKAKWRNRNESEEQWYIESGSIEAAKKAYLEKLSHGWRNHQKS